MGLCKYCGKEAGLFKDKHLECEAKAAIKSIEKYAGDDDLGWQKYKKSPLGQWQTNIKSEILHVSKKELKEKIRNLLTAKEIKILNEEHFFATPLFKSIDESDGPYSAIISSLRTMFNNDHYEICEKLFPVIDEYIPNAEFEQKYGYWDRKLTIYWKYKDKIPDAYANAKKCCELLSDISKEVSDLYKRLERPNWLKSDWIKKYIMILTKEKDFEGIIKLCEKAKSEGWNDDWDKRIEKAKSKLEKQKKE